MKPVNLGLATLVVIVLTATVGATSASGTALYKGGEKLGAGTFFSASLEPITSTSFTDTSSNLMETCTSSSLEWQLTNAGGASATASGSASHLTFGGEGCNVTVDQSKNGSLEIHQIAGTDDGTLTGFGFNIALHVFGTTCNYRLGSLTTGVDLGTLTGSTSFPATMDINAVVTRVEAASFLCPSSGRWIASYRVTSPWPLHVTAS